MWESYKRGFKSWLQLEKSLSDNSVDAYVHDIDKFTAYLSIQNKIQDPSEIDLAELESFVKWIHELGMTATSQSRIISGLRSFYKYCLLEQITLKDPTMLLEAPKLKRLLPDTLSFEEIFTGPIGLSINSPLLKSSGRTAAGLPLSSTTSRVK